MRYEDKDISTVEANLYGGDSFRKRRANFTEEAHSTEKAHFYGIIQFDIGGSVLWRRFCLNNREICSKI